MIGTLAFITAILTFSRSAWTVMLAWLVVFLFRLPGFRTVPRVIRLGSMCVICGIGIYILSTVDPASESVRMRVDLLGSAIRIILAHPLLGVGLGNFVVALPSVTMDRNLFFLQPVHNVVALLLSETGLFGLCVFLYLLFPLALRLFRILQKNSYGKMTLPTVNAFACIFLVLVSLVDHYPISLQQGLLMTSLLFGFAMSPQKKA